MYTVVVSVEGDKKPRRCQRAKEGQTLLEVLLAKGLPLRHDCGGVCHCTTCRIELKRGAEHLAPKENRERHFLNKAGGGAATRLACQCLLTEGTGTVELFVPASSLAV